jgi:Asp-tRNA(Asn)/Glu-tRNA(Gln) amidotransferase A subunit family amidase
MVPLAIGSQTNGSVIRPAAFCGVYGLKPSHGLISRHRVLQLSRRLDHVGVFARSIEDAALLAQALMGFDEHDPDTAPRARPNLVETAAEEPPVTPNIAFVKSPVWDQASDDTKEAFAELVEHLGDDAEEAELPEIFEGAVEWHRTIMEADLARYLAPEYERGKDRLSAILREIIERGQGILALDYNDAVDQIGVLNAALGGLFERYDALLTPATPGEAPKGLDSTGNPIFCTIWTLCGLPAVTLPILKGAAGMPMGAQLVAPKGDDARLLRTARWLEGALG